jgi:hypothetical protein
MKKVLLITLISIALLEHCNAATPVPPIKEKYKIVKVNGTYYKEKDGVLLPFLYGLALDLVAPNLKQELMNKAVAFFKSYFADKNFKILDASEGEREDVEVITINAQDTDNDGNIEFSSFCEDHDNNGENDDETEFIEYNSMETGLNAVLDTQFEYIDQYYSGDIDGDGEEN